MRRDTQIGEIALGDHRFGRVNRRMPIGPVRWPFHDLFWVHEGGAKLSFPEQDATLELVAPAGVLILPGTMFRGATSGAFSTASICHFELAGYDGPQGWLLPHATEALHLQNMIKLAMELAHRNRPDELERRKRLLLAILDGFAPEIGTSDTATVDSRLGIAWRQAAQNLHRMRTLADVAAVLGLSESTFRAMHRDAWHNSAGEHLRELRLTRAEELIVSTDKSLTEIAEAVGYRHAATLSAAFRARRGKTPGEYRRWSNPFA
jgi:AraC-like DNA-binding protein